MTLTSCSEMFAPTRGAGSFDDGGGTLIAGDVTAEEDDFDVRITPAGT